MQTLFVPKPVGFNYDVWATELSDYHDATYILQGISDGFDIGLMSDPPQPTYSDNPTLPVNPCLDTWILDWIIKCINKGFLLGPFTESNCPVKDVYFSPIFAVPKPDLSWRIICHLSYPKNGISINDLIADEWAHVSYIKFTEVVKFVYKLGYDARLWVIDAQDAYYRVPIKKKYWKYMGIKWYGRIFIMTSLQMGLSSACTIYERFADAVLYIICNSKPGIFFHHGERLAHHYLDDFFGGHWNKKIAKKQFWKAFKWFEKLGIPTKLEKVKSPHWEQKILGWIFNTRKRTVSLPSTKVHKYTAIIKTLLIGRQASKKQLEQICGVLHHAAEVIFPGKAFIRRLERVLHLELLDYDSTVILTDFVIDDLRWWLFALRHLNGIPMKWIIREFNFPDVRVWSDAATLYGMGACATTGVAMQIMNHHTFYRFVSNRRKGIDIQFLELLVIVVVAKLWAHTWTDKYVYFYCDNPGATAALVNKCAELHRHDMNFLVREFCKLAVQHRFRFWVEHIPGKENCVADELSRFKYAYRSREGDFRDFVFEDHDKVQHCVNQIYADVLKLPLNLNK